MPRHLGRGIDVEVLHGLGADVVGHEGNALHRHQQLEEPAPRALSRGDQEREGQGRPRARLGAAVVRIGGEHGDAAEQAEASSGLLSAMFLVFGTFTIAAGVLLSLTIIMLLADVRRTELATARALGLKRSDARAMFVYEGTITALISGALGSVFGLFLAWIIAVGFTSIFRSVGAQSFAFAWTWDSFVAGWIWGALLSVLLLTCSAVYNAQLNIVRALKGGRPPLRLSLIHI